MRYENVVAKDKVGTLYLYDEKPSKGITEHCWDEPNSSMIQLDADLFPEVKWSDADPTEVELVIKK